MNITQFPGKTNVVILKSASYQVNNFFGDIRLDIKDADGNEVRVTFESKQSFGMFLDNLCNAQDGKAGK
jgi:hypothetical protein